MPKKIKTKRGKPIPPDRVYEVMAHYAVSGSYTETAKHFNMAISTIATLVKRNEGKEEFVKLQREKKKDFAEQATDLINKGLALLDRRINTALEHENSLDKLIDEIYSTDREELTQDEKNRLVQKIRALQVQKLGDITTAVGTMYDKRALARGEATQNSDIKVKIEVV